MRRAAGVAALLCLVPAACAEEDTRPSEGAIVGELAQLFDKASPGTPGAAGCVGERLAGEFTLEELVTARLLTPQYHAPADMPRRLRPKVAEAWVDASIACVDYLEAAAIAYGQDIDGYDRAAFRACVDAEVDQRGVHKALVDTYTGRVTSEAVLRLSTVLTACADQQK
jgi:hypothetical protein